VSFHLPSFLLGYGAGATSVLAARHLRPLLVELATLGYRFVDAVAARAAMRQEDLEDLFAEAKARAARSRQGAAKAPHHQGERWSG
jgi:predicted RNA-binding Zn ribbon-like protein